MIVLLQGAKVGRESTRPCVKRDNIIQSAQPRNSIVSFQYFKNMAFMTRGRASRADTRKRCVILVVDSSRTRCVSEDKQYFYVL